MHVVLWDKWDVTWVRTYSLTVKRFHIRKELKDACEAMGIKDLRMAFHDKTLEFEDVDFVADKIQAIIQEVNPSRIITFYQSTVYIRS